MSNVIDIKVGYLCNNHCLHCAIGDLKRDLNEDGISTELTTEQVFDLLQKYSGDYDQCVLTGGEISLRKDCAQLINKALALYEHVQIQTNGRKWSQKLIDSIDDIGRCFFAVAVHGDQETHDKITQVKHSYEQTLEGLTNLSNVTKNISLKFVLSRINYEKCVDVVHLANQLGLSRVNIAYAHMCGDGRVNIKDLEVSYDTIKPFVTQALEIGEQCGIFVDLETFPMCKIDPRFYDRSDDLLIGPTYCAPVNSQSFDWDYERKYTNKTKPPQCGFCFFNNVCEGHWNEYNLSEMIPMYTNRPPLQRHEDREIVLAKLRMLRALSNE